MGLAVVILTRNEEKNIRAAIESASFADEIIVIDSGSTDGTEAIAKELGAKFFSRAMDEAGFAGQRNFALEVAASDWIFYLDADERIPAGGEAIIRTAMKERAAYSVARESMVMGRAIRHGVYRPDRVVRLFPKEAVHWVGKVHERAECSLPEKALDMTLAHYTNADWAQYFQKFNEYTTLMAERMAEHGKHVGFIAMLAHALYAFIYTYFIRLGFLDGKAGLILCLNHGFYTLTKYVKLAEINDGERR